LNQKLSYSQQIPWIQNKTIKENILFGLPYDEAKYRETIQICELTRDLEILPNLDETEIGEKGINLSGGQKARVSLARAVYADRDLILLDDPISALDANVKKKIFENVLLNHLKSKTIILVTHAIDFLHLVDRIVVMDEGEVVLQGSFSEIENEPYLQQLIQIHNGHREMAAENNQVAINDDGEPEETLETEKELKTFEQLVEELKAKKAKGKLTKSENEEDIEVNF